MTDCKQDLHCAPCLPSTTVVCVRVCVFVHFLETIPPPAPLLTPASAAPSTSGRPKVPTPLRGSQAPAGSAAGLCQHCVYPLPPPSIRASLALCAARLSMNVAPPPEPRLPFSPIAQVSANQAEPAACSANGAVSWAGARCHRSDWLDEA